MTFVWNQSSERRAKAKVPGCAGYATEGEAR